MPKSLASDSAKAALNMLEQEAVKLQNKVVEECTLTLEDKLQKIMQISDGEIKRVTIYNVLIVNIF